MEEEIMKKIVLGLFVAGLVLSSGCSMLNYSSCKKEYVQKVATQRAMASGDQTAIKAVASGNFVGVGIDLLDPSLMDVLSTHPIRSTFAAVLDAAAVAGATWAISGSFNKSDSSSKTSTVNLNGDQNTVVQGSGSITINHQQPMSQGDATGTQAGGDTKAP
jgi:hypothetical protein